jgi:hypothetical protein
MLAQANFGKIEYFFKELKKCWKIGERTGNKGKSDVGKRGRSSADKINYKVNKLLQSS